MGPLPTEDQQERSLPVATEEIKDPYRQRNGICQDLVTPSNSSRRMFMQIQVRNTSTEKSHRAYNQRCITQIPRVSYLFTASCRRLTASGCPLNTCGGEFVAKVALGNECATTSPLEALAGTTARKTSPCCRFCPDRVEQATG